MYEDLEESKEPEDDDEIFANISDCSTTKEASEC